MSTRPSATGEIGPRRALGYRLVKRTVDLAAAAAGLVVTAPAWIFIAVRIKRADGGPVLYRGLRVGHDGVRFREWKFRTMVVDAEEAGGPTTTEDDPRITEIGRWLRRTKLDELPQLVNVLAGTMSLVGPRPQVEVDVARYSADERRLLSVKPGITDWSSIRFRDEERVLVGHGDPYEAYIRLIRPEKIRLGLLYVDTASLAVDARILWETGRALVGREPRLPAATGVENGAAPPGRAPALREERG